MNTYGLGPVSVNASSFQLSESASENQKVARDIFVKALAIHNTVLQVFAYIPGISIFSGFTRIATGASMVIGSSVLHMRKIEPKFANDLANTGVMQIFRGMLESVLISQTFNFVFDVLATKNFFKEEAPTPSQSLS